ncbi:MAG: YhcH/YjgK/YiaL family protein, partial [Synergistaceae bacterium]|nr:YhcH/YjgK/YiaL family protein [Synergistaceae bacterium]
MLYGNIHNEFFSSQLKLLPVPLASSLRFLKDNDLTAHETGKFEIQLEGVNMILQVLDLETKTRNELLPEIHRKYIDVQFLCSGGPENATYYNDDGTNTIHENLLDS